MTQMRSHSLVQFASPLCEAVAETPVPSGHQVLVRIERCGLCHSDIHLQDGYFDKGGGQRLAIGCNLPLTLGHEIVGVVEEVGPDASSTLVGQRRAVFPWIGCGRCDICLGGDENLCASMSPLGVGRDGGFATHVLVPHERYLLDFGSLALNTAAIMMCAGVTAYAALKRLVDRPRQRNLLLIGMGGVGMMGLALGRRMFKQDIAVADLNADARALALRNGATLAYDPSEPDVSQRMLADSGGYDGVVDFVGSDKSLNLAMSVLGIGGKIVIAGLMGGAVTVPTINWHYKRMTIEGIMVGTPTDAKELLDLANAHGIEAPLLQQKPMSEVQTWIDRMRAGQVRGRVVLANG